VIVLDIAAWFTTLLAWHDDFALLLKTAKMK